MILSAVLLTGGASRRMGRDKAEMDWHGEPLWRRQLRVLEELGPTEVFVSARTAPPWLPEGVEFVADEAEPRGPLGGMAAVFRRMKGTHLLVLAVDMPFITIADLRAVLAQSGEKRGAVPVAGGRAEPLAAVYPAEAGDEVQKALQGNDFSLQPLIQRLADQNLITLWPVPGGKSRVLSQHQHTRGFRNLIRKGGKQDGDGSVSREW